MCSTPKGRSSRSIKHTEINSLAEEMSAEEYSEMVQRANQSYEQRQQLIMCLRADGKLPPSKLRQTAKKVEPGMLEYLFNLDFSKIFRRGLAAGKTSVY